MLNRRFRLVEPGVFEETFIEEKLCDEKVLVRPLYLSICHADLRYFNGDRPAEILAQKLPMSLIHEGVGEIVFDPTNEFAIGDKVVMIPNSPKIENEITENYRQGSKFRASGIDGFTQELVNIRRNRIVKIDSIEPKMASFMELVSVSYHAISRMQDRTKPGKIKSVGIWGNGNMGYIISALLKTMYPEIEVSIIGRSMIKNDYFAMVDNKYTTDGIPEGKVFDCAFECVGGNNAQDAINQIIDFIKPEGIISALGVSEELEAINMRMVLEKGLTIFGSSRSGYNDFKNSIEIIENSETLKRQLALLIGCEVNVDSIATLTEAFELDQKEPWGKTVMKWNI